MASTRILIVEDEKPLVKILRYNLEQQGYQVLTAADGEAGLAVFRRESPDLVLLDVMIPRLDGFEVCKAIRLIARTPILMLTARKEEVDRIIGLELGADDYVIKPFSVREVLARVKAVLRRAEPVADAKDETLRAGTLEADLARYEVRLKGRPVSLSTKEFELLKCLWQVNGKALRREELLEAVWGHDRGLELETRTVDQHINRLRGKLGAEASRLVTVKNVGYRLRTQ